MVSTIVESLGMVAQPEIIAFILLGLIAGIIFGALPGVGGVLGMAIVLPLTIPLGGLEANILLVAIYSGAYYGASIAAILINVPGTAAAAATTFDGYPMTQQGDARRALGISAAASAIGGGLTMLVLVALVPYLAPIVLAFGAPQIFLLALFGIVMIGVIASRQSLIKGVLSGMFGVVIMTIGISPVGPQVRYQFLPESAEAIQPMMLFDGFDFIAILIGMFALGEMLRIATIRGQLVEEINVQGSIFAGVYDVFRHPLLTLKSAAIGMGVGSIPGVGGSAANFFSYSEALRSAKDAMSFGQGDPRGVISAEASNNATIAGSLIPVLSFGIPGSAGTAVLLGGFILHGIQPGPELFGEEIAFTYALIFSLILGNIFIMLIGLFVISKHGPLLGRVDIDLLIPIVMAFAVTGAYALRSNWLDVATVFIFGILAFYMVKYGYSVIALVIGAVLAEIIETNLNRSMSLSEGSLLIFFDDPLSLFLVAALLVFALGPYLGPKLKQRFDV
ncbi:hypothetical protein D8Y22_04250 [Salinadaptatus halalkaliphilus]|uniref:DUF112 domain-containing protein n=1 Tax=Salinadaptatus halalkaliphilus TaxID=2419781 RepID=A0A4S3TU19_9EURY|nr:tripartite tricarboxylate transporter permease [Salinadaptatus halalkaliphilus]THE66138.1 hypothetical protein D8Y22_04250 [Salinadaptatus halalkaliphilus]